MKVSAQTEKNLRLAMQRLLEGKALHTDGRLIKENLYKEAKVSRATMNRAASVMAEWTEIIGDKKPQNEQVEKLKQELSRHRSTIVELRSRIRKMESELALAATAIAEIHAENQSLALQNGNHNVVKLPGK